MIDRILKAARRVADNHEIHRPPEDPSLGTPSGPMIETDLEAFEELVGLVAEYFEPRPDSKACQGCGAGMHWIRTGPKSRAPLDQVEIAGLDAGGTHRRIRLSHFATCPNPPGRR